MKQTPNLSLNKPEGTDVVNIDDLNANMDLLDAKLGTSGHNHNGTAGNGPKITSAGLAAGAANDAAIGSRTVSQALASPANAGTLTQLLSWLAGKIKAITGATNWYDAPAATLAQLWALFGTSGHSHNGTAGQGPKIAYGNISGAPTSMTPTAHASTATTYGVSSASNYGHAKATAAAPLAAGTAVVGTDNGLYARGDHRHPVQTSVSGNAGTATKLATARTIGGTSFDGTANIVPANCTLAASATKLATARTIGGTAFDGTANIVPANCTLAANATKLAAARTIALTGAITGSGSFDGSGNLSIATALGSALGDSGHLFAETGYQKFSNGLIIQWGNTTVFNQRQSFPIAFPNACFTMTSIKGKETSEIWEPSSNPPAVTYRSNTHYRINVRNGDADRVYWIAVGN